MLTRERPPLLVFDPGELLYVRFCEGRNARKCVLSAGRVHWEIQFKIPNQSANRSAPDSVPEDVLLPTYAYWGIVQFCAEDFPQDHTISTGDCFTLRPQHDPLPEDYYHTLFAVLRDRQIDSLKSVGEQAKTHFRNVLNQMKIVIREPSC